MAGHLKQALAVLAVAILAATAPDPAAAERTLKELPGTDLPGGDYEVLRDVPRAECDAACLADPRCDALTYNARVEWCFLKSRAGEPAPYPDAGSAIVVETAPADALPLPDLAFLPDAVAREADTLDALVSGIARMQTTSRLIDAAAARELSRSNVAPAWFALAENLLDESWRAEVDRREAVRLAGGAAMLGLRVSTTAQQQARALALVSRAMERQALYRPAIEASAASLTFALDAAEQQRLERLRRTHGFRVLDYALDDKIRTPRLCVQFSEPLDGEPKDLERFVSLGGATQPTLSVEDRQLCVEGLAHGERQLVTIRAGLPSTTGERLATPAEIRIFVRDRAIAVRFDSNRYVLPSASAGVPVITVNSREVELALYRVNDRNLVEVVSRGDFKRQVYEYELDDIASRRGALVWSGSMQVEGERNTEARTLFPVRDVIAASEPGVYVLTARAREQADRSDALATQWFVISDIGLATYLNGGAVDAFVRSLRSAEPSEGVALTLLGQNNEILATGVTDPDGYARLVSTEPLDGGFAPAVLTAQDGEDYAFVTLQEAAFELTDRGVAGRTAPGPVDAFLATERGVYRAGETVNVTALVRDDNAAALSLPVTFRLTRPDGVLSRRITRRTEAAGGLVLALPLTTNAATGTWRLTAHIDPDGPPVGMTRFLVEDFVPQRVEVELSTAAEAAVAGEAITVAVEADFLYGAPAADLMLEGNVVLARAESLERFPGYRFGLDHEPFTPLRTVLADLPRTAADGTAELTVPIAEASEAIGAIEAQVVVSVREPGGRQVSDALTLPVRTGAPLIGVRPGFEDRAREGSTAAFEVIALGPDRARIAMPGAEWSLTRIRRAYQWYRRDGRWFYEGTERLERVAEGTVDIAADRPARIAAPLDWGRYRLEVADPRDGRAATAVTFSAGWVATAERADTPDMLELSLDRERYRPGDTASVRIEPRYAGTALVTVLTDRVRWHQMVSVPREGTEVAIPVSAEWSPGAYVAVSLVRPAGSGTDTPLPRRAVGIAWMEVDTEAHRLAVAIDAPELAAPGGPFQVPIRVDGLAPGETAFLTVAAVDVGILNVTGYTPPDVDGHYLGQRRLAVELRDLYGDLIDGAGAERGRVRSGGDAAATGTEALPPNETPVSLFSGLIESDGDGRATATFRAPPFNGTVRIMAIAWSKTKVGDASADTILRDPVVLSGTLPRFLAPGDSTRMRFDLHNVSHAPGDYRLSVSAAGPVALDGGLRELFLARDERATVELPLAATGPGEATFTARLTGPNGLLVERDYTLAVRPAAAEVAERRIVALEPGDSTTLTGALLDGFAEDSAVSLSVGMGPLDVAGLLRMLDRFPFGCAEQTVSRALPLVYANTLARSAGLAVDATLPERIDQAIARVLSFQSSSGGFGLWSPGNDMWLTAYVMDFLGRAREAGHEVPEEAFEAGLDRLQSTLSYLGDLEDGRGGEIAYAAYVLARHGRASIGDLRYFAEERWDDFDTAIARAQLAASLALVGDQALADRLFEQLAPQEFDPRPARSDYGTLVRDAAASVTLAAESRAAPDTVAGLLAQLRALASQRRTRDYSTQEASWLVLSANAAGGRGTPVAIDGRSRTAPFTEALTAEALADGVVLRNEGAEVLAVASTVRGTPLAPQPPVASGLIIQRDYFALDGAPISPERVRQNNRLIVRVTVGKTVRAPMRLLLVDLLPAGFEIENPRLLEGVDTSAVPGVALGPRPVYTEFRDDRFAAAWSLGAGRIHERRSVAYVVRAVSPGTFVLPAAEVSDMYQPQHVARTAAGSIAVLPTR